MRLTKKKAKMVSKKRSSERDWGKGMACAGLTKHCTIVPHNHFGTIPGIPVGSMWWYRKQVRGNQFKSSGVDLKNLFGEQRGEASLFTYVWSCLMNSLYPFS